VKRLSPLHHGKNSVWCAGLRGVPTVVRLLPDRLFSLMLMLVTRAVDGCSSLSFFVVRVLSILRPQYFLPLPPPTKPAVASTSRFRGPPLPAWHPNGTARLSFCTRHAPVSSQLVHTPLERLDLPFHVPRTLPFRPDIPRVATCASVLSESQSRWCFLRRKCRIDGQPLPLSKFPR